MEDKGKIYFYNDFFPLMKHNGKGYLSVRAVLLYSYFFDRSICGNGGETFLDEYGEIDWGMVSDIIAEEPHLISLNIPHKISTINKYLDFGKDDKNIYPILKELFDAGVIFEYFEGEYTEADYNDGFRGNLYLKVPDQLYDTIKNGEHNPAMFEYYSLYYVNKVTDKETGKITRKRRHMPEQQCLLLSWMYNRYCHFSDKGGHWIESNDSISEQTGISIGTIKDYKTFFEEMKILTRHKTNGTIKEIRFTYTFDYFLKKQGYEPKIYNVTDTDASKTSTAPPKPTENPF